VAGQGNPGNARWQEARQSDNTKRTSVLRHEIPEEACTRISPAVQTEKGDSVSPGGSTAARTVFVAPILLIGSQAPWAAGPVAERAYQQAETSVDTLLLPNVFNYVTERSLFDRASAGRGLDGWPSPGTSWRSLRAGST